MKFLKLILLTQLIALYSCEKDLDYSLPTGESKLSLIAIFRPGEIERHIIGDTVREYKPQQEAFLGYSIPLNSDEQIDLGENDQLYFFENEVFIDTLNAHAFGSYFNQYTIPGEFFINRTYELRANVSGFENISGHARIPDTVAIKTATYDTTTSEVVFSFEDPAGQNFYLFLINEEFGIRSFSTSDPDVQVFPISPFDSILIPRTYELGKTNTQGYLTDERFNGQTKTIKLTIDQYQNPSNHYVTVSLYTITRDYYEFMRTYSAYSETKDNPFAEKVQIHSNVKNGLGLVGAAASTHKKAIKK